MSKADGRIAKLGGKIKNRAGLVLDKLTVLDEYKVIDGNTWWKCKCECGNEVYRPINKTLDYFKRSGTSSCGCNKNKIKVESPNARNQYSRYKSGATSRNLVFELTFEEFMELTQKNCVYCGIEPSTIGSRVESRVNENLPNFVYNGIDRVDNTIGYLYHNCVTSCSICNLMKRNLTEVEFKTHISKIYKHLQLDQ